MTFDLNSICLLTRNPALLNALHACKPGHPWNVPGVNHYLNAWFLAAQRPAHEISCAATLWLKQQADKF